MEDPGIRGSPYKLQMPGLGQDQVRTPSYQAVWPTTSLLLSELGMGQAECVTGSPWRRPVTAFTILQEAIHSGRLDGR